jgi:hypothetical protein
VANCTTFLALSPTNPFVLGNNTLMAIGNIQFLVLGMLAKFGTIPIPFLHINPNILVFLLMSRMLTKRIPLRNKQHIVPFQLIANLALDNMQATI